MSTEASWVKDTLAQLFAWAHERGSALKAVAVVQLAAVLVAWVLGHVTVREVVDSLLAGTALWAVGALVRRSIP